MLGHVSFTWQGRREKGPNVAEFIVAFTACNNEQLVVVNCAKSKFSATALGAAAQETGGCAVCILPGLKELNASSKIHGNGIKSCWVVKIDIKFTGKEHVYKNPTPKLIIKNYRCKGLKLQTGIKLASRELKERKKYSIKA